MILNIIRIRRNQSIIIGAFVISIVNLLAFYSIEYSKLQRSDVPLGWDTPSYVVNINLMKEGQISQVLKESDYVNFMYHVISSFIPATPLHIEMYFPIVLAILAIICFGTFSHIVTHNVIVTSATMLILSSSFALFRISSDLHSQLLSIVLMFFAFVIFLRNNNSKRRWSIIIPIIVFVSSFTHFENTFFLFVIFILSWFFVYRTKQLRKVIQLLFIPIIPSIILYILHLYNLEYFPPNLQIANDPISYDFLLLSIGAFLPLLIAGIGSSFYLVAKQQSLPENRPIFFFIYFSLIWFGICLILFRQSYFTDTFFSFSYRAAVFLPLPFIGSIPFLILNPKVFKKINYTNYTKYVMLSFAIVISLCVYNLSILFGHEVEVGTITYVSDDSFSQLVSLSNSTLTGTPVFVLYPKSGDVSPGGMSVYIDHWVSVFYGPHSTYLGFVDAFLTKRETPFSDPYSRYYSYAFSRELNKSDAWRSDNSADRRYPIVLLENFYDVEKVRNNSRYERVVDGVYLYKDKGNQNGRVVYSISSVSVNPVGWYMTKFRNETMVETYQSIDDYNPIKIVLPLNSGSCYLFELQYLDASKGLGYKITSKDEIIHLRYYDGGGILKNDSFRYCASDRFTQFFLEPISNPMLTADKHFTSFVDTLAVRNSS